MTPEEFDAATPQERNEAIAIALGWKKVTISAVWDSWYKPDGTYLGQFRFDEKVPFPGWQGNEGLAFAELWPEILKLNPIAVLGQNGNRMPLVGLGFDYENMAANTWAHAICKAFLALKATMAPLGVNS